MTVQELYAKRAKIHDQAKAFLADAEKATGAGDQARAEELNKSFESAMADFDAVTGQIEKANKLEAAGRVLEDVPQPRAAKKEDGAGADEDRAAFASTFEAWLRHGVEGMTSEQRELQGRIQRQVGGEVALGRGKSAWVMNLDPRITEKRDLAVGTGGAGGFTVADDNAFISELQRSLKAFGGMRQAPTRKIVTATGGDLPIPANDDTGNVGELLGEAAAAAVQDSTFTQIVLQAFKYSSKIVKVSQELLQDSAISIPAFLGEILGERLGRITNTHFTTGDGTGKPRGIVTAASLGKAAASATAIAADELIDFVHSVDPAYRSAPGVAWQFSDTFFRDARKLKGSDNNYLWQPGLSVGEPDRLLGHPFVINQDIAVPATTAKVAVFGDMSRYWIRDVQGVILLRLDELYAANLQVGFIAFLRTDGDLLDPGTDPVKFYQMA